jgi:hypothetical protein
MALNLIAFLALAEAGASQPEPSGAAVTRPILGFVVLLALAYIAGRPQLAEFEKKLALKPPGRYWPCLRPARDARR